MFEELNDEGGLKQLSEIEVLELFPNVSVIMNKSCKDCGSKYKGLEKIAKFTRLAGRNLKKKIDKVKNRKKLIG